MSTAVSLTEGSIRRIIDAMPPVAPPTVCMAGGAAAHLSGELTYHAEQIQAGIGRTGAQIATLIALVSTPRAVAAAELCRRGIWAAVHGWGDEARADLRAAIESDPYNPVAHLAMAYVDEGDAMKSETETESGFRAAIRFGIVADPPVAVRAAIDLADRLQAGGDQAGAAEVLATISTQMHSLPILLALSRVSGDSAKESELLALPAAELIERDGTVCSDRGIVSYRPALDGVLDAAALADVDLSALALPRPEAQLTEDDVASIRSALQSAVSERWPRPLEELLSERQATQTALDDVRTRLAQKRADVPEVSFFRPAHEKRLEELESSENDLVRKLAVLTEECTPDQASAREQLRTALEALRNVRRIGEEAGVAPLRPGLSALLEHLTGPTS